MPKSTLLQGEDSWWMYGTYYLEHAEGNDSLFRRKASLLCVRVLGSMQSKMKFLRPLLKSESEQLPESLYTEQPRFIFNAFKGGNPNHVLFHSLQKAQKQTKALLRERIIC